MCSKVPSDPAHIRVGSNAGMGQKPDDSKAVPLCRICHSKQHQQGERTFWGKNLEAAHNLANALFVKTSDYEACLLLIARFRKVLNAVF